MVASMLLRRKEWLVAPLLLFASASILLLACLQYNWPGKWWGNAVAQGWKGEALTLVKGQGEGAQGSLTINGLTNPGVALATLSTPAFRAEDYTVVRWSISSLNAKSGSKVEFLWRTAENPKRVFARPLEWVGSNVALLEMEGDESWRGHIVELMLMVHAPLDAPLVIKAVKLEPFSPLEIVWREWFGAEPWLGTSINFVGGDELRKWLAPLPFAAVALGLALLGYGMLVWQKILATNTKVIWALVFLAWFALDMRWQIDLWHKLGLTQQRYAGKSWEKKHLAAEDGHLFDLMQQIRAKLPSIQSRVFLFADEEYLRVRSAYHLYPFNVLTRPDLLPASAIYYKSGDFIVILGKDEVEFDPAQQLLKWGEGQKLSAELLLLVENNVLLRVR